MEFEEDNKALADLELVDDQKLYVFLLEDDEDDDEIEYVMSEVLDPDFEGSGSASRKGSGKSRKKLKKRSIDSGWLESMQQQLHGW